MKLCVIIPNYQHDHLLVNAVGSIGEYPCRVQVVNDYPRKGKGFRMNETVPTVGEEWLTIHDADDVSAPGRFEICSNYFDDYDVIYHDVFVQQDGAWKTHKSKPWEARLYRRRSFIAASTVFVRTEIARQVRWITSSYGQDWIWLNLIAQKTSRFKYVPHPLLYYSNTGFTKNLKFKSIRRQLLKIKIARLCA